MPQDDPAHPALARRLGTGDAVVIGLSAMIGAGVFTAFAPAAAAAGPWLPAGLAVAAAVALFNATSSARLAARYPSSGGTYVYGRERLGPFWGHLAGWSFVVGKTGSCAAMALTVGSHLWPGRAHAVAAVTVLALTALNYRGVQKSALFNRAAVAVVLGVLAVVIVVGLTAQPAATAALIDGGTTDDTRILGVLQAGGLLFFAFAGYARIATLGEEVRDPGRTIRRAVPLALSITAAVYLLLALSLLHVLGAGDLAAAPDPLVRAVVAAGQPGLAPVVRAGAVVAAVGALLALILGVSRTTLAMARDGHLPRVLAAVHPRFRVPHHAELAVGGVVASVAAVADLRAVIGFSSFGVLLYYAVTNAAAWTLTVAEGRPPRVVPMLGLLGCLVLAATLPATSVAVATAIIALGVVGYLLRRGQAETA